MDTNKITDPLNRGMVAGLLGMPADMVNMLRNAGRSVQNLTLMAQNKPTIPMQQDPAYGQEWWGNKMQQMGYVTPNRNPVAEFGAGLLDPTGIADTLAAKAPMLTQGLFNLGDPALMTVTKGLLAKKAYDVAPDVARAAAKNLSAPATLNAPRFAGQRGAILGTVLNNNSWFDEATNFLKQVENLSEKHGKIYVRWSANEASDLAKGAASRDYLNGGLHAGLSAIPITGDMHPSDIAKRIAEYSFLRMQNKKSMPRIYLADKVGVDSDGYDSISNLRKLTDVPDFFVSAIDKNFAKIFDLNDDLESNIQKLGYLEGSAKEITLQKIEDIKEKLKNLGFKNDLPPL